MSNKSVPVEGAVGAARIYLRFRFHRSAALALSLASVMSIAPTTLAMPGLKIAVKTISPNQSGFDSEKITYIQDDRRRVEDRRQFPTSVWPGGPTVFVPAPRIVSITRCDLNQIFLLNLDDREYMSTPVPKFPTKEELQSQATRQSLATAQQPTMLFETTTKDTGERKEMFGFTARHVITTRKQIPLVETGQLPQEALTDGWYIDLDAGLSCDRAARGSFAVLTMGSKAGEPPRIPVLTFKEIGNPERGFALTTKEVNRSDASLFGLPEQPNERISNETQVTEISKSTLDPALFEVPANFRKVSHIRQLPYVSYWTQATAWLDHYWVRLKRAI